MTDLRNGIIDFGEIIVTPKTTKQDLLAVYGAKLSPLSTDMVLDFNMLFSIDGHKFISVFYFNENNTIDHIEMRPCITYKSEKWDRTGRQEERRAFCDKWLYEQLGTPHKVLNGDIEYSYPTHTLSCFSNFDIRDGANAGYIVIAYK